MPQLMFILRHGSDDLVKDIRVCSLLAAAMVGPDIAAAFSRASLTTWQDHILQYFGIFQEQVARRDVNLKLTSNSCPACALESAFFCDETVALVSTYT